MWISKTQYEFGRITSMPYAAPDCTEHIGYGELERYALNGAGNDVDAERIEAHLRICEWCSGCYKEEKVYIELMRAALSAFGDKPSTLR